MRKGTSETMTNGVPVELLRRRTQRPRHRRNRGVLWRRLPERHTGTPKPEFHRPRSGAAELGADSRLRAGPARRGAPCVGAGRRGLVGMGAARDAARRHAASHARRDHLRRRDDAIAWARFYLEPVQHGGRQRRPRGARAGRAAAGGATARAGDDPRRRRQRAVGHAAGETARRARGRRCACSRGRAHGPRISTTPLDRDRRGGRTRRRRCCSAPSTAQMSS